MTDCYNNEEENKLSSYAYPGKNTGFKYSLTMMAGRVCTKNNKAVKPRFSGVSIYKAAVMPTAAIGDSVTLTSSTIKNEQAENTLYAFSYYHITADDIKCSCYVCSDLAEFKPKKQNDASLVSVTKEQAKRGAYT